MAQPHRRALGVEASDLVTLPIAEDIPFAATLDHEGAHAPRRDGVVVPPQPAPGLVAITVASSSGDYRSGDEIWRVRIAPQSYAGRSTATFSCPPAGRPSVRPPDRGREDNKLHIPHRTATVARAARPPISPGPPSR